ncbi:MAG: hypothetical protein KBS81_04750 [Spirochaetales bacterium]|nr:hypothetical protein [Candidatus Physcosoma equi]
MLVKLVTMVDLESFTASLKVVVKSDRPVSITFQGETRTGKPVDGYVIEDFYALRISLWEGMGKGKLFSVLVDGKEYRSGFRTIGLDAMRGFFLNAVSYPLGKENVVILGPDIEESLLETYDEEGRSAFVSILSPSDVEKYYNHPSVLGWILPSSLSVEELKAFQKECFTLDKTRPSALLVGKVLPDDDPLLRVTDLLFFQKEGGGVEKAKALHQHYSYRCVGTMPGEGDAETRFLIIR